MNFSRHQKQHLRQVMRNLANLLSAARREWRDMKVRGHPLIMHTCHSVGLPEPTFSETRRGDSPLLQDTWGRCLQ